MDFELEREGTDDSTVLDLCRQVLKYSVVTRKQIHATKINLVLLGAFTPVLTDLNGRTPCWTQLTFYDNDIKI